MVVLRGRRKVPHHAFRFNLDNDATQPFGSLTYGVSVGITKRKFNCVICFAASSHFAEWHETIV
jgi:hypothetical protein